jgi:hypothetical protein
MIFAKTVSAREEIMCMSSGGFSQIVETCLQKWGRRRNETGGETSKYYLVSL